ncbi:hypothetical protein PoB_002187200 [Plakobranchus ocellatus]|uniref:Uncharacterized protein n=1 Tax=Plakobranchus ocellatus TaxID=259542 RepID=A0AAV3ZL70_9GAST|nr:hypothetical protein PoB_002187200 [Plakobranchus ocellatus]
MSVEERFEQKLTEHYEQVGMEVLPLPTDADVIIISMRRTLRDGDEEFGIHHEEQFSLRIPGRRGTELLAGICLSRSRL